MLPYSDTDSKAKSQQSFSWNDAHYCGLRSQTNVYSLSELVLEKDKVKFLAASIDGHLTSVKFDNESKLDQQFPVTSDDVLFDFDAELNDDNDSMKGEIEVVSIDTVPDWDGNGSNILAVTYLKLCRYDEDKRPEAFMNIYKLMECDVKVSSCNTPECLVQELALDFIPFKLTHHSVPVDGHCQTLLLLSGNDSKIHTYLPAVDYKGYEEVDTGTYFPEVAKTDDSVTQIAIKQLDDLYRLTSYGTQNGFVGLYLVNAESKDILNSWTSEMDSPITSLKFFQHNVNVKCPDLLNIDENELSKEEGEIEATEDDREEAEFNLLVTSALDPAIVYEDVLENGLSKCRILPLSNSQDVILSSCVMDVDFDGENEVLIGTYGKVLLVYKLVTEKAPVYSSTPFHSPMPVPIHSNTPILPGDDDKADRKDVNHDIQEKEKDVRRRHRTVAVTSSCAEKNSPSKCDGMDKHRSDTTGLSDVAYQQAQMLRMVRSTENLASPSVRSIQLETPDRFDTPDVTIPQFAMTTGLDLPAYKLMWSRRFCNPLMGLACGDVMGDGMLELIVLTLKGLHILQPDLNEIATLITNRLQQMTEKSHQTDMETTV